MFNPRDIMSCSSSRKWFGRARAPDVSIAALKSGDRGSLAQAEQGAGGTFTQTVTLGPGCLPAEGGRLYLAMLNTADYAANIIGMRITRYAPGEVPPADSPGLTTCEAVAPPEPPSMP